MNITKLSKLSAISLAIITSYHVQADQVISDDLIVDGSICVGQDCVNGESFGFDTLRLKENNLRIRAVDSSSSSSFPTADWQITFNDSANGGLNRFSIDDIDSGRTPFTIIQSAPNNSLFIKDNGFVGFNTAAPVVNLHLKYGNSPTLRLEQDGSSGFTSQTWDVAGNETNFFVRDATNGSKIPFKIKPGATNDSLFIAADGDVGLETSTPDGQFDVAHSTNANNHAFLIAPNSNVGVNIDNGQVPNGLFDVQTSGGNSVLTVSSAGNVGIGEDTPLSKLHINATGSAAGNESLLVKSDKNSDAFIGLGAFPGYDFGNEDGLAIGYNGSNNGNSFIGTRPSTIANGGNLNFAIENYTIMTLTSNGLNLSAGKDFSVDGTNLNVPDYVFAEEYNLRSIEDVETYISKNKHLPGVPSEKEIQQGALGLGSFQMKLLEKIEELTLYTISQEKRLKIIQQQNITLNKKLEELSQVGRPNK